MVGTPRDVIEGKKGYFHMAAWSVPLVLTVVCLALKQVSVRVSWVIIFESGFVTREIYLEKNLGLTVQLFNLQIDGDSVSGICFVGNMHGEYRGGFVLAPVGIAIACGLFFLLRGESVFHDFSFAGHVPFNIFKL